MKIKIKKDIETGECYLDLGDIFEKHIIDIIKYYRITINPDNTIVLTVFDKRKKQVRPKLKQLIYKMPDAGVMAEKIFSVFNSCKTASQRVSALKWAVRISKLERIKLSLLAVYGNSVIYDELKSIQNVNNSAVTDPAVDTSGSLLGK